MLTAAGGSAALLLPLLRNIEARADGAKAPLRLLIIHHPLGTTSGLANWVPAASASGSGFSLPMESVPFALLQSQLVLIDGLNLVTATSSTTTTNSGQDTHQGGMVALMTGVPTLGVRGQQDHCAGGASIDQLLLQQSPLLGGPASLTKTPFGSLSLAADIRSDRDEVATRVMSYLAPVANPDISEARQPIYPETQPLATYQRLFGGALPSGTVPSSLLTQKLSVLDFMRADLARLNTLLPASERDKLAAHATAIQSLEARLRQSYVAPSAGSCTQPAVPPAFTAVGPLAGGTIGGTSRTMSQLTGEDYYPLTDDCTPSNGVTCHASEDIALNQLHLIKTAFACDLVRVATFMYAPGENWVMFPSTFQGATLPAGTLGNNAQSCPHHLPSHSDDAGIQAWLGQIDQYYSTLTSQVLQEFAATPDIDGNSLLDNTVVLYVTEVTRSWDHKQQNIPVMVFGGKNTGLNGGTYLKVTDGSLTQFESNGTGNRPFNDLWLALAPVFGVHWPSLGSETQFTGPLSGIFG